MKKIFLSLAVIASVALVSCGGNKAADANAEETGVVEEVAVVEENDTTAVVAESAAIQGESATVAVAEAVETPAQ